MPRKKTATSTKKAGSESGKTPNKTAFVLNLPASMSAKEVIDKGKAAGIKLTDRYVYSIRSKAKVRGDGPARRGRPRGTGAKPGPKPGRRAGTDLGAGSGPVEKRFFDLALDLGLSKAESLLANLRSRVRDAIG